MVYDFDIAQKYDVCSQTILRRDWSRTLLRRALKVFSRDRLLVDVGCGGGLDFKTYRSLGYCRILGVEPSPEMRRIACGRVGTGKVIRVLAGDWTHLPLADGEVGILVSRYSLHYCEDIKRAFGEAARVLRPGGMFVAIVSHPACDVLEKRDDRGCVTTTLHNGTVKITYPFHRISDYLGRDARKYFSLLCIRSFASCERDDAKPNHPTGLFFVARRYGEIGYR